MWKSPKKIQFTEHGPSSRTPYSPTKSQKKEEEKVTLCGHIDNLTATRTSASGSHFFHFFVCTQTGEYVKAVCFDPNRHGFLEKSITEKRIVDIKNAIKSSTGILIKEFTILTISKSVFPKIKPVFPEKELVDVLNSCVQYENVTVKVKVHSLKQRKHDAYKIQEAMATDESNAQMKITFFDVDVTNNATYKIEGTIIGSFMGEKVLKVNSDSILTKVDDLDILVPDSTLKVKGKICAIEKSSMAKKHICVNCKESLEVDDGLAECMKCDTICSVDEAEICDGFLFTLKTIDGKKIGLECKHSIIGDIFPNFNSNPRAFFKNFINCDVEIDYNKQEKDSNNIVLKIKKV